MVESKPQMRFMLFEEGSKEEKKQNELYAAAKRQQCCSGVWEEKPEERQKTLGSKDWDRVYSYEEKRLKSYIEGEEYGDWERQNRSWELENGLVPLLEEEKQQTLGSKDWERVYSYEEKRLKSYIEGEEYGDWEKQNRSWELENGLVPLLEVEKQQTLGSKDWERVYSYEEKRLKSYLEGEEYGDWEKQNRSWELENGLVPLPEERRKTVRIYFSPETAPFFSPEAALEEQKKQTEAYNNRLLELSTKVLTEEEKKLKESYLQKWGNWRLGLSKETFFPFGPGWDLAWYTELPENSTVKLVPLPPPPPPPQARPKVPLTLEDLQHLCQNQPPTPEISWEDDREKLAAEGRCLDGSYLTPYCKCDRKCYQFDTVLKNEPPESLPIWLAYCRQYRQSHCFDIDDYMGGVCPLTPYQNFDGRLELLMELANLAIQEYNEKECNVFKYKVMKIEKANCCVATSAYWMTVKVSNLTLCSVIETFQIHAGVNIGTQNKIIFCCRPKEEVITGLPLCEFCFGLLPGEVGTSSEEEFIVWKKELPGKFLSNANLWNDDDFLPKGTSEQHRDIFRQIYQEYFRQIIQSNGFDIDKYPGDARAAVYIPYLEFEKEADMLMELANHAIDDYNNRETSVFKYKIDYIEKVNVFLGECREYFMTVKVFNLALYRTIETVQIHAYKGPHEENIVSLCRKKVAI